MTGQDVILGSRVAHLNELRAEIERLRAENARLRAERDELRSHFDAAIVAAHDLAALPSNGRLVIVDGWNMILGANREARDAADLEAKARAHLAEHPCDFVWIVYDGPREAVRGEGRLRVSWTGGTGAQRADRFICDFLRAALYTGGIDRVDVWTRDREILRAVARLRKAR